MSGSFNVWYEIVPWDAVRPEGQWGATPFTFRVVRTGSTGHTQTMNWQVDLGPFRVGEVNSADFTGPTSGQITFSAGNNEHFITVYAVGDTVRESDERFRVLLTTGRGPEIGIGAAAAEGVILADEPTISVTGTQNIRAEGESGVTRFTFTATRSGSVNAWDWVDWYVAGSGARPADGADFAGGVAPWGRAVFAPGERTVTITVDVVGDRLREGDEEFILHLLNPSPGAALSTTQVAGRILADEPSVGISSQGVIVTEGQWGSRNADFVLFRSGSAEGWAHVDWYVSATGEDPAEGADFAGGVMPWGRAVFAPGQTQTTVSIAIAGDVAREGDETFRLNLVNPSAGMELTQPTATATILPDEPTITVVGSWNWRAEGQSGSTPLLFTAVRESGLDGWDWVDWYVTGSGARAANGADFAGGVAPWGRAVFAPGERWASIEVWVSGDTLYEGDEEFTLNLVNPSPGAALATTALTGRILADEPSVSLVASNSFRAEGNGGSTPFIFTAIREGDLSGWAHADWLAAGTGTSPADAADFAGGVGAWGRAVFAPGEKWATITVNIAGDTVAEAMEDFTVNLVRASTGLAIANGSAGGRILPDEGIVSVLAPNGAQAEAAAGTTPFAFTVTRSGDLGVAASVGWSVVGSGASPAGAADFGGTLPSGRVQFAAGETSRTVTVSVARDAAFEGPEGFALVLSDPSPALSIATGRAEATILGDVPTLSVARATATRTEGASGPRPFTFTVTLDAPRATATELDWTVAGSGLAPANAADFESGVLPGGRLVIPAGATAATITVPVLGDRVLEQAERFTVTIANATGGVRIGTSSAEGVIQNDDSEISIAAIAGTVQEGDGMAQSLIFAVTRAGATSQAESIAWRVDGLGSNPVDRSDFVGGSLPSGTVRFAAGETERLITLSIAGDNVTEAEAEGFEVVLIPAAGTLVGGSGRAIGTVQDDDILGAVWIVAAEEQKAEGSAGPTPFTFTFLRSGGEALEASVDWGVGLGGFIGIGPEDLAAETPTSGRIVFAPGETRKSLTIHVSADRMPEDDEFLAVSIFNPSLGLKLQNLGAVTTVVNDDPFG